MNEAATSSSNIVTGASSGSSVTRDGFHNGDFQVLQPKGSGHRSGLDALLLAAALPKGAVGDLADLGAGSGTAGLAALNLNPDIDLTEVEINPDLVELAQQTLMLVENSDFRERVKILQADVTLSGVKRLETGLNQDSMDFVIMNPPYNSASERASPDPERAKAHSLGDGGLDPWLRTAAAITRPGGMLVLIYRTQNLGDVLACCQGRFGGLEILPVHSRGDEASKRMIVRGIRGSRAPMSIVPGFTVHKADGTFTRDAKAIFDGNARLEFAGQ